MSIRESLSIIYEVVLLASAILAVINFKWLKAKGLIFFAPFLCCVFIQEFLMHYFYWELFGNGSNDIVYNVYRFLSVIFFSLIYYRIPFLKTFRKYIVGLAVLYTLAFILTFGFLQSIFDYNGYLGLARGFIVTFLGLLFLFCYFQLDSRIEEEFWSPWIWITIGIVIFYPVISISQTFLIHLYNNDVSIIGIRLYNLIPQLMSIFMYGCFTYAFYLCKKKD